MKFYGLTVKPPQILFVLGMREEDGIHGVAVKCVDIMKNTGSEGDLLAHNRRSGTKAWGANRIRYPGSPRPKLWIFDIGLQNSVS